MERDTDRSVSPLRREKRPLDRMKNFQCNQTSFRLMAGVSISTLAVTVGWLFAAALPGTLTPKPIGSDQRSTGAESLSNLEHERQAEAVPHSLVFEPQQIPTVVPVVYQQRGGQTGAFAPSTYVAPLDGPPSAKPFGLPDYPSPQASSNHQPMVAPTDSVNTYNHSAGCECQQCAAVSFTSPGKAILAVDGQRRRRNREPRWRDAEYLPWESLAYGEYIGPVRTPHLPEYRVRVGDQIDFTFRQTREITQQPYRLGIGDVISVSAEGSYQADFGDENMIVLRDGTVQVRNIGSVLVANKTISRVQEELNALAQNPGPSEQDPNIIIKVVKSETELNDLIRTVDATNGQGGQFRTLTVSPDGTVQLPALGSIPAIGLSLDELGAEANARYGMIVQGLEVTPSLRQSAPTFAYVLGEANNPGRIQLSQPTTVMQLVAQAGGWRTGANLREIVVFRRDENWQLIATRLDLSGPMWGNAPHPSDDLWVRNNDIILLPKTPAQRVVDFIDIYFSRGLYGVLPSQGFSVNFDGVSSL